MEDRKITLFDNKNIYYFKKKEKIEKKFLQNFDCCN